MFARYLVAALVALGDHCLNFYDELYICPEEDLQASWFKNSNILAIDENSEVRIADCQLDAPWHLHSIRYPQSRQQDGPYKYPYLPNSPETLVYVLDTFIDCDHPEFAPVRCKYGPRFMAGRSNGHGTHVAGLVAGNTYGVNRNAQIVAVQVLDDNGFGSWQTIAMGLQSIANRTASIINLSISGPGSSVIDSAVLLMIQKGWKFVIAAGNDAKDACQISPARVAGAVTVGAHNQNDELAKFSNYGSCVDINAPGERIVSAVPGGNYAVYSGTSMAAPIVAGMWSLEPKLSANALLKNRSLSLLKPTPDGKTTRRILSVKQQPDDCVAKLKLFFMQWFSSKK